MTNETKTRLEVKLVESEKMFQKFSQAQGDACGENCDWHDNSTYEFATQQTNLYATRTMQIKRLLKEPITLPREDTDVVGIGNTVKLKVGDKEMMITLLSDEDSMTRKEWLSIDSPIGQKILGKPIGKYDNVEIIKILKGDFK